LELVDKFEREVIKLSDGQLKKSKKELISNMSLPQAFEEKELSDNAFLQSREEEYQGSSGNKIFERVENYLWDDANSASSSLIVKTEDRRQLELNYLLPKDCRFTPSSMFNLESYFDEKEHVKKNKIIRTDLKEYQGMTEAIDYFACRGGLVEYGNLTKKGGMLSLLHEIAHAWQNVYYEHEHNTARASYEETHWSVSSWLHILSDYKKDFDSGNMDKEEFDKHLAHVKKRTKEVGIEFDENNFIYDGRPLEDEEIDIYDRYHKKTFIFKSKKFKDITEDYVGEERNAWAHAIKVLRFLRQQGIDLEPEMKTVKDFQDKVHSTLSSYQQSLEKEAHINMPHKKFTSKAKAA